MKKKIILLNKFPKIIVNDLKKKFKNIQFIENVKLDSYTTLSAIISLKRQQFESLFLNLNLKKYVNLKWIHIPFSGAENLQYLKKFTNIDFTNSKKIQSTQVAEHAIGMLLALSRKIYFLSRYGIKAKFDFLPIELKNKKILILGYGSVGQAIAKKLRYFDVIISVLVNKKFKKPKFISKVYGQKDISKAFRNNDIIFIAIPLNKKTYSIISDKQLNSLKKDSLVISISRENIFNLKSLKKFLNKKKNNQTSFGLDFFSRTFIEKNRLLSNRKNVLLTPHIAGLSDDYNDRHLKFIIKNIKNFQKNLKLENDF